MADWVAAISSLFSAIAALFSLLAFLSAMKMQREDSINDVQPELLLLDWTIEDQITGNYGPTTNFQAAKSKNVGRGPAFDIFTMSIDSCDNKRVFYGSVLISPYTAAGSEEEVEVGFIVLWDREPSKETASTVVKLLYSDLGKRRHSVNMHISVTRTANYNFSGAKRLAPRLFMRQRKTTVIEQSIWKVSPSKLKQIWVRRKVLKPDKPAG